MESKLILRVYVTFKCILTPLTYCVKTSMLLDIILPSLMLNVKTIAKYMDNSSQSQGLSLKIISILS